MSEEPTTPDLVERSRQVADAMSNGDIDESRAAAGRLAVERR